eukprot:983024-Alexandrium_andersonii.AAC.1
MFRWRCFEGHLRCVVAGVVGKLSCQSRDISQPSSLFCKCPETVRFANASVAAEPEFRAKLRATAN